MKGAKMAFLILTGLWVILWAVIGYLGFGVSGEGSMFWAIIIEALTFPSYLLLIAIVNNFECLNSLVQNNPRHFGEVFMLISFMLVGYLQWFIILPYSIILIKKVYSKFSNLFDSIWKT